MTAGCLSREMKANVHVETHTRNAHSSPALTTALGLGAQALRELWLLPDATTREITSGPDRAQGQQHEKIHLRWPRAVLPTVGPPEVLHEPHCSEPCGRADAGTRRTAPTNAKAAQKPGPAGGHWPGTLNADTGRQGGRDTLQDTSQPVDLQPLQNKRAERELI